MNSRTAIFTLSCDTSRTIDGVSSTSASYDWAMACSSCRDADRSDGFVWERFANSTGKNLVSHPVWNHHARATSNSAAVCATGGADLRVETVNLECFARGAARTEHLRVFPTLVCSHVGREYGLTSRCSAFLLPSAPNALHRDGSVDCCSLRYLAGLAICGGGSSRETAAGPLYLPV